MAKAAVTSSLRRSPSGWAWAAALGFVYAALYALNFWLPLERGTYATRIWNWSQLALAAAAGFALLIRRQHVSGRAVWLGLALGATSGLAHLLNEPSLWGGVEEALCVWACFLGGTVLFQEGVTPSVPTFQPSTAAVGRSLLFGTAAALPLAVVNNLYFLATVGQVQLQNPLTSALAALSPGIHEEVIFRYFVLALCLYLLRGVKAQRVAVVVAVLLAVVPHSLNHLPDLFLSSPRMALVLLLATCLLFGLPMAILQLRRNLETAITFHWFIDFARFLFGF